MVLFSGAQMHSSVPNTSGRTTYSIDCRTVQVDDVAEKRGAPRCDEHCTGTTMRDYLRCSDLAHIPDPSVALYETRRLPRAGNSSTGHRVRQLGEAERGSESAASRICSEAEC